MSSASGNNATRDMAALATLRFNPPFQGQFSNLRKFVILAEDKITPKTAFENSLLSSTHAGIDYLGEIYSIFFGVQLHHYFRRTFNF